MAKTLLEKLTPNLDIFLPGMMAKKSYDLGKYEMSKNPKPANNGKYRNMVTSLVLELVRDAGTYVLSPCGPTTAILYYSFVSYGSDRMFEATKDYMDKVYDKQNRSQ